MYERASDIYYSAWHGFVHIKYLLLQIHVGYVWESEWYILQCMTYGLFDI